MVDQKPKGGITICESPKKTTAKRKKDLTPNSKASRKKQRRKDDEVEDSIRKLGRMHVSPAKTAVASRSCEVEDDEKSLMEKEDQDKDGTWCYAKSSENLSRLEISRLLHDIDNLMFSTLYPNLITANAERLEPKHAVNTENKWVCPEHSCPIRADVRTFDFKQFATFVDEKRGHMFDIIMMDPPWKLTTSNPTRGVCISYACLADSELLNLPITELQTDGYLLIWVINSKMTLALEMFDQWGYDVVDSVDWVKMTVNRRLASGHGYYLQHAFETCLIGSKGSKPKGFNENHNVPDIIYSQRRGQSQKPEEIYEYCEELVENGLFLEIFGRRNNLRNGWITIGNEI